MLPLAAAMYDPCLEALVIVSLNGPAWPGSPSAACCLEPVAGLSRNKLVRIRSFPAGRKRTLTSSTLRVRGQRDPLCPRDPMEAPASGFPCGVLPSVLVLGGDSSVSRT